MNIKSMYAALLALLFLSCQSQEQERKPTDQGKDFVTVQGSRFMIGDQPYFFLGTNFWYAINLGSKGQGGNRDRLLRELDRLKELGITNLRIMGMSEGPDSEPYRMVPAVQQPDGTFKEELLEGLDFALAEMAKRDMRAVICLSNFWPWSGGFAQYVQWSLEKDSIPYPPPHPNGSFDVYQSYTASFYSNEQALQRYYRAVEKVVGRTNTISQLAYKDDPTIMSWELCNEPRGINHVEDYLRWIDSSSSYIKKLDPKHLITVGSEGETASPEYSGCNFMKTHQFPHVDYTTIHIWIQNWGWYDPRKHDETYERAKKKALDYFSRHMKMAKELNKPFVLEEFGIMKDQGSFDPKAATSHRDDFYNLLIGEVLKHAQKTGNAAGVNFWAWAGEGRPRTEQGWWKPGDNFIGDPPHEEQGWYSVYDTDSRTLQLLKSYGDKFKELGVEK